MFFNVLIQIMKLCNNLYNNGALILNFSTEIGIKESRKWRGKTMKEKTLEFAKPKERN